MKKFLAIFFLTLFVANANADVTKEQKNIVEKLTKECGLDLQKIANSHTEDEWQNIKQKDKLTQAIKQICPNIKTPKEDLEKIYDLLKFYAAKDENTSS